MEEEKKISNSSFNDDEDNFANGQVSKNINSTLNL